MRYLDFLKPDLKVIEASLKKSFPLLKDKKILITGATGFFGKWMLYSLLYVNKTHNLNFKICSFSRNSQAFLSQYPEFAHLDFIEWHDIDLVNPLSLDFVPDYVLHMAAEVAVTNSGDKNLQINNALKGFENLLTFIKTKNSNVRLLFVSSGAVYGRQDEKTKTLSESLSFSIGKNDNIYAEIKRAIEDLCIRDSIDCVIARPFAFSGPFLPLDGHFALGNFVHSVLNEEKIIVKGTGTDSRSYMYGADLIIWLISILLYGKNKEVYNVGSNEMVTIKGLAEMINSLGEGQGFEVLGKSDVVALGSNSYVPNIEKAKNDLGLDLKFPLTHGLQRMLDFYKLK